MPDKELKGLTAGAGQRPEVSWTRNPDGARSLDAAIAIAQRHGIQIPQDVDLFVDEYELVPSGAWAMYFLRDSTQGPVVTWSEFFNNRGKIPVLLRPEVLASDEAIVAVLAHELHEIGALRTLFAEYGGSMSLQRLHDLISPGIPKNLHDEAWDVSDRLVQEMRRAP